MNASEQALGTKKGNGMLIFLGILCILLGILAIATPLIAGTAVTIIVGIILLAVGMVEIIHSFHAYGHKLITFLKGLLSLTAGGLILARPLFGMTVLTMMLAIYFLIDGIMWCIMAFKMKPAQGWGMGLFNGIITFLLGFLIWKNWPLSGVWAIGILVGIRIMMAGWSMIFFNSISKQITREV